MAFAKMPSSCELRDTVGRDWAVQIKPVGAAPDEYRFVPGIQTTNANITTAGVDSTTIDSNGWTSETKTSRTLTIPINGKFVSIDGLNAIDLSQRLLQITGEEIGGTGSIDARIWRTDVDEGWEGNFNVGWATGDGDATGLRTFTATLTASCAPTRIHSVEEGAINAESVPMTDEEVLAILEPGSVPPAGDGGDGGEG